MWFFGNFPSELWSLKFIEIRDLVQVLFRYFKDHGPKRDKNRSMKSAIELCTILLILGSAGSLYHAVWMIAVSISARVVLKEIITPVKWISISLCIGGSALVVVGLLSTIEFEKSSDPASNVTTLSPPSEVENEHHMTTAVSSFVLGIFICVASGIIEMSIVTFTKLMEEHIRHVFILSFWCSITGLLVSVIFMLILELDKLTFPTDILNLLYLATHTICTGIACVIYFVALQFGSAIVCSIALNAEIPFRVLFQYVLAKNLQPIDGSVYDIIGAVIVTLGVVLPPVVDFIKLKKVPDKDEPHLIDDRDKDWEAKVALINHQEAC